MLAFLRKIRKEMFKTGKVRSYFFYALGEIILIMIGILLALQVNNWNEKQKQEKEIDSYLQSMKKNLQEDLVDLRDLNALSAFKLRSISYIRVQAGEEYWSWRNLPGRNTFHFSQGK
jgi:hypothetical protein